MVMAGFGAHAPVELLVLPVAVPDEVGHDDVARLERATGTLRAWDARHGGGACHEAVPALLSWGQRVLDAQTNGEVSAQLYVALADLYNLAGWAAFDLDQTDIAHRRFDRAFTLAQLGGNDALLADIGHRRGRIYLHQDSLDQANLEFQLGQRAADASGSAIAAAVLYANQAWACAKMGMAGESLSLLGHSVDQFLRSSGIVAPWARFFDTTHLLAMSGVVYTELAQRENAAYTRYAIPALTRAAGRSGPHRSRRKSLILIALATSHLIDGRADRAAKAGVDAMEAASKVTSARVIDGLLSLRDEADLRPDRPGARELSERITEFIDVALGESDGD
jgi:hypothetical protein